MNYPTLPGLTLDGKVYYNAEMGTVESIVPPGSWATCHGPAMLELPNGDLLCCWFAGTFEGDADIHVVCARLPKGADQWEEPVNVSPALSRTPLCSTAPTARFGACTRPSWTGSPARTICSTPLRSAARSPLTAARPGAITRPSSPKKAPSAASPSRS